MGDERTYENTIAIRAVNSVDGMTANWSRIPHDVLDLILWQIAGPTEPVSSLI